MSEPQHDEDSSHDQDRNGRQESGPGSPTFLQIAASVFAAAIGVQSDKNRVRDFTQGNPIVFIVAGLIFTVLFVLTLVGLVMLALP